jgi:hypothetical protein
MYTAHPISNDPSLSVTRYYSPPAPMQLQITGVQDSSGPRGDPLQIHLLEHLVWMIQSESGDNIISQKAPPPFDSAPAPRDDVSVCVTVVRRAVIHVASRALFGNVAWKRHGSNVFEARCDTMPINKRIEDLAHLLHHASAVLHQLMF